MPNDNSQVSNLTSIMNTTIDPLYVIFEQHLYHFDDAGVERKVFIENIIRDYLAYLSGRHLTIPRPLFQSFYEDHYEMINSMLIKKIYGSLSISEYQSKVPPESREKAKERYNGITRSKTRKAG